MPYADVVLDGPTGFNLVEELTSLGILAVLSLIAYTVGSYLWKADSKAIAEDARRRTVEENKKKEQQQHGMGQSATSAAASSAAAKASSTAAASSSATEKMVMALFVRQDLKMGTGKSAAQCAHAAVASTEMCMDAQKDASKPWADWLDAWRAGGSNTVVYKVTTEDELKKIAGDAKASVLPHYLVRDAGRTQIAAGSRTVTAVGPAPESVVLPMAEGFNKL